MNPFNEQIQRFSVAFYDKIRKTCAPLVEHFFISHFSYTRVNTAGEFCSISNNPAWQEHYFAQELFLKQPHFRHPKHFCSGVSIPGLIEDEKYVHIAEVASQEFHINPGIVIIKKDLLSVELYGFDIGSKHSSHVNLLLNEIDILQKFISHFEKENHFLIHKLKQYPVNIASLMGNQFHTSDVEVMRSLENKRQFLQKIGVDASSSITRREKQILKLLVDGFSASATGKAIHLSPRTIESYILNIKNKLQCDSKLELIQKGKELLLFGLLE